MKREEAKRKMNFLKEAYQKLIDEGVDNGTVVGKGVRGTWKSDTTLTKAYEDMIDACDVAIEALSTETCDDAISRQAVINEMERRHQEGDTITKGFIKSLPPVNPTRLKGKWMKSYSWSEGFGMGESYGYYYECSQCGKSVKGGFSECGQNFCPNCGAKMEREETV